MMQTHNSKNKFSNISILENTKLKKAAKQLNNELLKIIDKIAPATTKAVTSRHKNCGTMKTLKIQRMIMKNRERKWIKCREDQHWKVFKRE